MDLDYLYEAFKGWLMLGSFVAANLLVCVAVYAIFG